jgi:hypothetical protein
MEAELTSETFWFKKHLEDGQSATLQVSFFISA